jgi:phosphatidate phosphatase PAH1
MRPIEPWFSRALLKSQTTKEKLHKKAKKGKLHAWDKYKAYRNIYYRTIRAAKLLYYTKAFNKAHGKGKQTLDLAKQVTGHSKNQSQGIGEIEGCQTVKDKTLAFNKFYINIAPKLATTLPKSKNDFNSYLPKIDRGDIPRLNFQPVTFEDVETMLAAMLGKVSFSHDGISNCRIKRDAL